MGMALGDEDRELAGGAADVAQRLVAREVELLREGAEVARRDAAHGVHELLEALRVAVQLLEHPRAPMLDLVLRLPGAERLGEVPPEAVETRIRHLEEAADVAGAFAVEEERGLGRVPVAGRRSVAVTLEEAERDQRVEEVRDRARMESQGDAQLLRGPGARPERREEP